MDHPEPLETQRASVHGLPIHPSILQQFQQQHQQFNPYSLGSLANIQQAHPSTVDTAPLLQSPSFPQGLTAGSNSVHSATLYYPNSGLSHPVLTDQIRSYSQPSNQVPIHPSSDHLDQNAAISRSTLLPIAPYGVVTSSVSPAARVLDGSVQEHGVANDRAKSYHLKFDSPLKLIENPPDLQFWRDKLFHVDEPIFLTEDHFQTYFPHVDNVYSHRSTQKYKLKPFVSHYWDCRLKGRPPGTAKSTDPNKKKRKRVARERDLCDVKIKITEYARGTVPDEIATRRARHEGPTAGPYHASQPQAAPNWSDRQELSSLLLPNEHVQHLEQSQKWFSIQRVNGNGGNGKNDGIAGPHKHSLEESDRVKKNSVIRSLATRNDIKMLPHQKTYAQKATGDALATVKAHSKDADLRLYGACFCPFVQRVWIALEYKHMTYQYIEVDPYKKPQSLLDISPKGLVPAIRHGTDWSVNDSAIIMEYLEDLAEGTPLLPSTPQQKAHSRLWTLHCSSKIIPAFYRYLQEQDGDKQAEHAKEFKEAITTLVHAADPTGPFFLGPEISFVDVQVAPWIIRMRRVLTPYRGWPEPESGTRYAKWVDAIENHEAVKATTSTDDLYLDSYERYAENRPNTSQLADAINAGRGLP